MRYEATPWPHEASPLHPESPSGRKKGFVSQLESQGPLMDSLASDLQEPFTFSPTKEHGSNIFCDGEGWTADVPSPGWTPSASGQWVCIADSSSGGDDTTTGLDHLILEGLTARTCVRSTPSPTPPGSKPEETSVLLSPGLLVPKPEAASFSSDESPATTSTSADDAALLQVTSENKQPRRRRLPNNMKSLKGEPISDIENLALQLSRLDRSHTVRGDLSAGVNPQAQLRAEAIDAFFATKLHSRDLTDEAAVLESLADLDHLRDQGHISQAEYTECRGPMLGRFGQTRRDCDAGHPQPEVLGDPVTEPNSLSDDVLDRHKKLADLRVQHVQLELAM
eukprot:gene335-2406_t